MKCEHFKSNPSATDLTICIRQESERVDVIQLYTTPTMPRPITASPRKGAYPRDRPQMVHSCCDYCGSFSRRLH